MSHAHITLKDLVSAEPDAARVLHRHGIDFCCGKRSLAEVCAERGVDSEAILRDLEQPAPAPLALEQLTAAELTDVIIERYHQPLRAELPRLRMLAAKVERVHKAKATCPQGLAGLLEDVQIVVEEHLAKEEQILFPIIRAGRGRFAHMPVRMMMQEHDDHLANLAKIRRLTSNFSAPDEACNSWRALYAGLAELDAALTEHIQVENDVLFPAVLADD